MAFKDSARGLLGGLQRFSTGASGLLFPGFGGAGVDPEVVRQARAQAMMQTGFGLLGGQDFGQAYGMGQKSGWEPIEQGRREAVMRAAAADRQAQADERERRRKQEEAALAEEAALRAEIAPLAAAGDYAGIQRILAGRGQFTQAKAAKDLGGKGDMDLEYVPGPNGTTIVKSKDRWQVLPPERAPVTIRTGDGGGGGYGKAPSGYRWKPDGSMEPVPGGPSDPSVPQRTTLTPKDASTARQKINQINAARQQLALAKKKYEAIQNSFSMGPGGQFIPTPAGKEFDAAVDSMRGSITAITRVPGVGAMSDFETRLDQAKFPKRGNYESVAEQQLQSLEDLLTGLEQGYQGMLGFENPAAPAAADAPKSAQMEKLPPAAKHKGRKVRDTASGKVYVSDGMTWKESP